MPCSTSNGVRRSPAQNSILLIQHSKKKTCWDPTYGCLTVLILQCFMMIHICLQVLTKHTTPKGSWGLNWMYKYQKCVCGAIYQSPQGIANVVSGGGGKHEGTECCSELLMPSALYRICKLKKLWGHAQTCPGTNKHVWGIWGENQQMPTAQRQLTPLHSIPIC